MKYIRCKLCTLVYLTQGENRQCTPHLTLLVTNTSEKDQTRNQSWISCQIDMFHAKSGKEGKRNFVKV